ncbi:MAG TPA: transposase [Acidimicrobiales bacterium]
MGRCRSYRYLLQPTVPQRTRFEALLRHQCELYNAALEERRGAWKWERRSVSYIDQSRTLTTLREPRPEIFEHGVTVCRGTLKRLDRAFGAFYRRCRAGQTPGFPRFKSSRRWDSVQWEDTHGWGLNTESRRLRLLGIGEVKVRLHREVRGTPKAITVAREGRRWWVTVRCVDVPTTPLAATGSHVGIDLGVCAQVATSGGQLVVDGRYGRRASARLAGAQRELVTKRRGSRRRERSVERVAAAHRKVRNQRKDLAHKLSRELVNRYDLIVHEDLKIANMVRRPLPRQGEDGAYEPNGAAAKAGLNRSISDAGWGQLLQLIAYKAEDAGREVIAVDPRHTSQRCSSCGHLDRENRRTQAEFRCRACGHEAHADVNAAMNILRAGRARQASACDGSAN